MSCPRYYELRRRWETAARLARLQDTRVNCQAEAGALQHLRAHAEECRDCIRDFAGAFPELVGKMLILENLSEREMA